MLLSGLSFGSVTVALFIFKIAALIVHLGNCFIFKKITKSNKYMLLYGINPLVLIELLSNVHNDIYLIFFLLVSLYFLIKKKNIHLTILFLILSIALKYSTVLIVPFILLYCFREKTIPKRILWCSICGIIILLSVVMLYMPFYKDISIFTNMLVQDGKFSQSIMAVLIVKMQKNTQLFTIINSSKLPLMFIIYIVTLVKILFEKNIRLKVIMKKYNMIMIIFIFLCLTTFQKWYVLWLFPTLIWQNKNIRNYILLLTMVAIIPSFGYFKIENDAFSEGIYYSLKMITIALICTIIWIVIERVKRVRRIKCQD